MASELGNRKDNSRKHPYVRDQWIKAKREARLNPVAIAAQRDYRIAALKQRDAEGRMTDGNREELSRLEAQIAR